MSDKYNGPTEFIGQELSPEEYTENRLNETRRNATEALALLSNPMVQSFLEKEKERATSAFKNLPMEARHEQYMALKVYFNCLDQFEEGLKKHITLWNDEQIKQERAGR